MWGLLIGLGLGCAEEDGCVTLCEADREDCYAECDGDECLAACDDDEDACVEGCL